jgi:MYXO-CTERM domain-containing protein
MMYRLALALLIAPAVAHAYSAGASFDQDALGSGGGGDGIAFDGAPRWTSHTCAVCHTDAAGTIGVRLEADHPELFTDGWKPGMQYHLRVVLENEHEGVAYTANGDMCGFTDVTPFKPCNKNGFALEVDDESGAPQGTFAPVSSGACASAAMPGQDATTIANASAMAHVGVHNGQTQWDLCWTAPAAGAGSLVTYVAVVDGNGGTGTAAFTSDPTGDDTVAGAVPLAEAGATPPAPQTGGCSAGGEGSGLVLVAIALFVRRRRRAIAALLACGAITGCVHVRPRERETLAHRNMKFAPDPAEDELDLHMQEAREGSTGGYGSSGGGCGCN